MAEVESVAKSPRSWLTPRGWAVTAAAVTGIVVLALVWSRAGTAETAKPKPMPVVTVMPSAQRVLPMEIESSGNLVALNEVEIRPRIDGTVRRIGFKEGDQVKQGQILFELEVDDVASEVAHARAESARIAAEIEDAQANLQRGRNLVASSYISSSALDALVARHKSLRAQLQAANANARGAEARLDRATIRAPMDARAGMAPVRVGARVRQADALPLVVLRQFDPIGVDFTLPERMLDVVAASQAAAPVRLHVVTEGGQSISGELRVIDNVIDPGTGTIQLRAQIDNSQGRLWPGAFVRVKLEIEQHSPVVVVPPQSVGEGPEGHFVYTVSAGVATRVPVSLLRVQSGMAVIEGLESDQTVVVEGVRLLRDGSQVQITDAAPAVQSTAPGERR